jgi:hypothetical protein
MLNIQILFTLLKRQQTERHVSLALPWCKQDEDEADVQSAPRTAPRLASSTAVAREAHPQSSTWTAEPATG